MLNLSEFILESLTVGEANSTFLKYFEASSFGKRDVTESAYPSISTDVSVILAREPGGMWKRRCQFFEDIQGHVPVILEIIYITDLRRSNSASFLSASTFLASSFLSSSAR